MDNRIFNVNGKGLPLLMATLQLAFRQEWDSDKKCAEGWAFEPDKGLVLLSWQPPNKFLAPLSADECAQMVFKWLNSEEAKTMKCEGWDGDVDHDGHNGPGWRVFVEDWGHVAGHSGAICCIRPVFLWYGK